MKKFLLTLMFTFIIGNAVSAAEVTLKSAKLDETGALNISGTAVGTIANQQISLTVSPLKEGLYDLENIVYIDQKEIEANNFSLSFSPILADGHYVARIGGSGISDPKYLLIEKNGEEQKITLGDVNMDGSITAADSALALQYVLNKASAGLTPIQAYIANVTHKGSIDSSDSAWILSRVLNGSVIFPAEN